MNRCLFLACTVLLVALAGCATKPPPADLPQVFPVTGKVVDKQSGAPITGGAVQFESLESAGQTGIAEIQPDGTFTANTFVDGTKLVGLVRGSQRVTFMPRAGEDQASAVPVTLAETFDVKEAGNDFTLQVEVSSP